MVSRCSLHMPTRPVEFPLDLKAQKALLILRIKKIAVLIVLGAATLQTFKKNTQETQTE